MKKFLFVLFTILTIMCFSACDNTPVVEKYYLDANGNLIAELDDGTTNNLGTLGTSIINGIENIEISDDGYYIINGIITDIVATEIYKVSFNTGFDARVSKQFIEDGYKVERPEIEREGYTLNGWYCNGEEWRFNSDVVKSDMVLTADWIANKYTVSFATGIDSNESPIEITYNSEYELPEVEQIGYTFDGWLYKGNIVTASKWNIAEDCTLTAKWIVNKYTVSLNANGGIVSPTSEKIEYGKQFNLPIATNSYGTFIGWFYNGVQITDSNGNSLFNWTYTTDIEVTTSWTIELSTVEDLQKLRTYPNGHFELKNNLDISLIEWTPVGTETKPFTGQIDGGKFTINGLKITQLQENQKYYGFIGYAQSGKIYNLGLTNVNINLPTISNTVYIGSVIAKNENAMLENIIVSGSISIANHSSSYESYAGGLIGYSNYDYIKGCINSANIIAKSVAGGIIGYKDIETTGEFKNNKNIGSVEAIISGGLIGDGVYCVIENSCNEGSISGVKFVGGLVGRSYYAALINKCFNSETISLDSTSPSQLDSAGGIIGSIAVHPKYLLDNSEITNSYNTGNIESKKVAGGIIGSATTGAVGKINIQNCYNAGTINAVDYAGGIAGYITDATIKQCINLGNISKGELRAIFCYNFGTTITDCYYNCSTSGIDAIQGTKTTEKYSATFYTEQLFWDSAKWDFHTDKLPTLKPENT